MDQLQDVASPPCEALGQSPLVVDTAVTKPYVTKLYFGRWWVYIDTKRKHRWHAKFLRHFGVVSYKKVKMP